MFRIILWFIIIYFVFRFTAKYIFPILLKHYLKRFQQKFYQQNPHINPDRKEGETNVDYVPDNNSKRKQNTEGIGEYVDYEEIETK